MEEENFFCEEDCIAQATKFYLGKVSKRKVCEEHALSVVQELYPISGFFFISTPEDAVIYQRRCMSVTKGRAFLELLKVKASEDLQTALQDLDSARDNAIQIVMKAYDANIRRTKQLHFQIEVGIQHLLQEFDNYLKSPDNTVSQAGSLLMTYDQFVPALFQSKVIDTSLELVEAAIQSTCFDQLPLEEYLPIVLDPDLRREEAEKLFSQAEDESHMEGFIYLQNAVNKYTDSISIRYSDNTIEILNSLKSRLTESVKNRNETIRHLLTSDIQAVSSLIETALSDIGAFEVAEEWDKTKQAYLKAISYANLFSCSKEKAVLYSSFASFLVKQESRIDAESYFRQALAIQQDYFPEDVETADTYEKLGAFCQSANKPEEAENCYKSAVAIRKAKLPYAYQTSKSYYELAKFYQSFKRYEEAEEAFSSALSIQRVCVPNQNHLVSILWGLGEVYRDMKTYEKSAPFFIEAIHEETSNSQRKAFLYQDLGDVYKCLQQKSKAEENFRSSLAIYKQLSSSSMNDSVGRLLVLGVEFGEIERLEDAELCYQTALTVAKSTSTDKYLNALLLYGLGSIKFKHSQHTEAISNFNAVLRILVVHSPTDKLTALTYINLGILHMQTKHEREAEHCFRSAAKILDQSQYSLSLNVVVHLNLGILYQQWSRLEEAEQHFCSLLSQLGTQWSNHICTAHLLMCLGALYMAMERYTESEMNYNRSLQIIEASHPELYHFIGTLYHNIGLCFYVQKKHEVAVDYYIKAISLGAPAHPSESSAGQRIINYDFPTGDEDVDHTEEHWLTIKQGLILLPNYIYSAYTLLGSIFFELEQYLEAEYYLTTAVEIDRTDGDYAGPLDALSYLQELYLKTNQMDKLRRLEQ